MERHDEVFELVDDDDEVIGKEFRGVVHCKGLLHRAVYCWVFNTAGELLIQQRSFQKSIGPGKWDLSVAEHVQPGENYRAAAIRGLSEELGIHVLADAIVGPLQPTHCRELRQGDFHDVELVQSFRLDGWNGSVALESDGEVIATRWLLPSVLKAEVEAHPEQFTEWMRQEAVMLAWFVEV
jgi:isopentenyl-diphosphate delta-isomerase type 1